MPRKRLFPPPTSANGKRKRHKGRQAYSVLTINGRMLLRRVRWHCVGEGSETPMDRIIDEAEVTISEGVREMACRVNGHACSFQFAADTLWRTAHIKVSKESLRQLVETEGKLVLQSQRRAKLGPTWSAAECKTSVAGGASSSNPSEHSTSEEGESARSRQSVTRVYCGCDGVKIPLVTDQEKRKRRRNIRAKRRRRGRKCKPLPRRKAGSDNAYKEFKIAAYYDQPKQRTFLGVTAGNHEAAGHLLRRMADQIGFRDADERVALIDGAPWIRNQIEFHGLTDQIGLDFYHLQDYAQATRRAVFGEESEEGRRWLADLMHVFKHDGYQAGLDLLLAWRKKFRQRKRQAVDRLLGYVVERRQMLRYPEFRRRGWDIGSGPTESACKTTTQRVKGRGRRWDAQNAQALMALAALQNSNQWNQHWTNLNPERN